MAEKKPLWVLDTSGVLTTYEYSGILAEKLKTTPATIIAALHRRKDKHGPAKHKNYLIWDRDPYDVGITFPSSPKREKGSPLLLKNPTHHIGVW
jgi:hypothetical protein